MKGQGEAERLEAVGNEQLSDQNARLRFEEAYSAFAIDREESVATGANVEEKHTGGKSEACHETREASRTHGSVSSRTIEKMDHGGDNR